MVFVQFVLCRSHSHNVKLSTGTLKHTPHEMLTFILYSKAGGGQLMNPP